MRYLPVLLVILFVAGCDSTSSSDEPANRFRITLDVDGLVPLQDGFRYQVWAMVDNTPVGSTVFNVNENGQFVNNLGQIVSRTLSMSANVARATTVMVTINGKTDSGTVPSNRVLMAGDVDNGGVTLSVDHPLALGAELGGPFTGAFQLATPSDTNPNNELGGLWFGTGQGAQLQPTLDLPELPSQWIYEGWISLSDGTVFSTGKFSRGDRFDESNPHSFQDVPLVPGEDFLLDPPAGVTFPPDFSGAAVFVTVEMAEDDNRSTPFAVRLLEGSVPASPQPRTPYALQSSTSVPGGSAEFSL
ncbi:MAG: hypothetical protein RIE53_13275 [Rhodothermales bacterium]